jgi:E3 ubiquitin-protein ligase listerin
MGKGQKSSASSATRKKHAKKAAAVSGEVQEIQPAKEKKLKGKEKSKKKVEPRKKIYIPPVKPRPAQPDPLDALGIAYMVPSELLVILRLLGKKDAVTKVRALEELQTAWVTKAVEDEGAGDLVQTLVNIIPVWVKISL